MVHHFDSSTLSKRLLVVLLNAEVDLKKLEGMPYSQHQKYFDDRNGFRRHEFYLDNVMSCNGRISDLQREENG